MATGTQYAKHFSSGDGSKIHLAPDIPLKKLHNALASYGDGIDPEEVILLVDDTVFGGAKEGFILTRENILFKEISRPAGAVPLQDGVVVTIENGFLGKQFICANGSRQFGLTASDKEGVLALLRPINKMIRGEFDPQNCTRERKKEHISSAAPERVEKGDTKQCPFCGEEIKAVAIKCRFCGEMLTNDATPPTRPEYDAPETIKGYLILLARQNITRDIQNYVRENENNRQFHSAINQLGEDAQRGDVEALHTCGIVARIASTSEEELKQSISLIAMAAQKENMASMRYIGQAYRRFSEGNIGANEKAACAAIISIASEHCNPEYCARKTHYCKDGAL